MPGTTVRGPSSNAREGLHSTLAGARSRTEASLVPSRQQAATRRFVGRASGRCALPEVPGRADLGARMVADSHRIHGMISGAIDGGQSALRLRVVPGGKVGTGPGYVHGPNSPRHLLDAIRGAAIAAGLEGPVEVAALGLTGL